MTENLIDWLIDWFLILVTNRSTLAYYINSWNGKKRILPLYKSFKVSKVIDCSIDWMKIDWLIDWFTNLLFLSLFSRLATRNCSIIQLSKQWWFTGFFLFCLVCFFCLKETMDYDMKLTRTMDGHTNITDPSVISYMWNLTVIMWWVMGST